MDVIFQKAYGFAPGSTGGSAFDVLESAQPGDVGLSGLERSCNAVLPDGSGGRIPENRGISEPGGCLL